MSTQRNLDVSDDRPDEVTIVRTNAVCTDLSIQKLMGPYLCDDLDAEDRALFDAHRKECIHCDTCCNNWLQLVKLLKPSGS